MTHHLTRKWLFYLLILLLITACSGGGSSNGLTGDGTLTQGIAVDPYIEGAVFQELKAGTGAVLQRQSSSSDEFGRFTFPKPLTPGSIVELKISNKGLHGGAPYRGMLRRLVTTEDGQPLVVSPLTTLIANGFTPEDLIAAFHDAGLTGLTIADLHTDPMAGLANMTTGVTDQDLKILQAAMAANAYMEVTGNFHAGEDKLNEYEQFEILKSMIISMENLLNADEFAAITAAMANDPDISTPLTLGDFILAVLDQQQTIVALAREDMESYGDFSPAIIAQAVQNARENGVANIKSSYSLRVPSSASHAGQVLYQNNCSGCHNNLASTNKPGRSAADIKSAIHYNAGGMGFLSSLTPDEVQAIADILPPPPVVDPNLLPDGAALYSSECAGCHQPLNWTKKPGRSAAAVQAAIDNNLGGMGFLSSLTPDEVRAIADVLPQADDPGTDYNDCTLCHGQPPDGDTYPDTTGAHAAHTLIASVGTSCSICHLGAEHNSRVDLGFPAGFAAMSGPAIDNMDGTCSSIKCHGGQTTPDWWNGAIVVDAQCASCHISGTSQYNSYSSGMHRKHVRDKGYSCTACHNTTTLRNGHFINMESSTFELSPAATIGGGSTRVGSYNHGTCSSIDCHGAENWYGEDD